VFKGQNGKKIFDLCLPNVKDAQKNSDKSDLVLTFEQVSKPKPAEPPSSPAPRTRRPFV
jgi:hypothetical protein